MNFQESLEYLYSLGYETLAMKFGLDNTRTLLTALGEPQKSFIKIQIAGTNGKGSTAAFLDSICRAAAIKTGLFTSPHLISATERIKIDGRQISENEFAALTTEVREAAERLLATGELPQLPTFFEHLTVIGLLAMARNKVALATLETGLGGRLDSVTAADAEFIGITPISFDHQEYLGDTLAQIAAEKSAIIRSDVRAAIIAEQLPQVREVIAQHCLAQQVFPTFLKPNYKIERAEESGLITASFQTTEDFYENVEIGLRGRHQLANAALAVSLAEKLRHSGTAIPRAAIMHGLATARHDGRLDWRTTKDGFSVLFDGAHNAAGATALKDYLREFYPDTPLTLIFGAMRDKDLNEIAAVLFPLAAHLILTRPANPRSADPEDLIKFVSPAVKAYKTATVAEAFALARQITAKSDLIGVTGSLYLVGEAQAFLSSE